MQSRIELGTRHRGQVWAELLVAMIETLKDPSLTTFRWDAAILSYREVWRYSKMPRTLEKIARQAISEVKSQYSKQVSELQNSAEFTANIGIGRAVQMVRHLATKEKDLRAHRNYVKSYITAHFSDSLDGKVTGARFFAAPHEIQKLILSFVLEESGVILTIPQMYIPSHGWVRRCNKLPEDFRTLLVVSKRMRKLV